MTHNTTIYSYHTNDPLLIVQKKQSYTYAIKLISERDFARKKVSNSGKKINPM